jgi:hypothetical protein
MVNFLLETGLMTLFIVSIATLWEPHGQPAGLVRSILIVIAAGVKDALQDLANQPLIGKG